MQTNKIKKIIYGVIIFLLANSAIFILSPKTYATTTNYQIKDNETIDATLYRTI